jgi:HAD superfamily hydrolase (TIGR01509 family)
VFDLDGLMFNTEDLYRKVGGEILRRRGKPVEEALFTAMMGRQPKVSLQIMIDWHRLDATVGDLAREAEEIFEPMLDRHLTPMPGLLELLGWLETSGIPKAIATSSPRSFVSGVLSRFDLAPRFSFVLTSEDVVKGKPDPEIYLSAARRFELQPSEILVLEDSHTGCRAAIGAGAYTVAVPGDYSRDHDFTGTKLVANSLSDRRIYEALAIGELGRA